MLLFGKVLECEKQAGVQVVLRETIYCMLH